MAEYLDKAAPKPRGDRGEWVAEHLRNGVFRGRYVPGQRLVEADLTAELGISRNLLRETFRQLSAEGLIEIVPNRGALVRRLSMRETLELFTIRMELESLAARLAAERCRDDAIRHRFDSNTEFVWSDAPRISTTDYIAENQRFHTATFEASGNQQLDKLNNQLQLSLIMAQIMPSLTVDIITTSLTEHRAIARAILDRDADAANTASRAHLLRARDMVRTMPPEIFKAGHADPSGIDP
ncbi:GntR family transcriptional regulator [Roseovarius tibetensis]|uniref:GntR family transcriptional regulator n=1 Tax=Roseovarius tibetensis TaxID=2685897 RepID=UPI003D7F6CED